MRFDAQIEWKDVFHSTHNRFGRPSGSSSSKRAYYAITGIQNVTGEPGR